MKEIFPKTRLGLVWTAPLMLLGALLASCASTTVASPQQIANIKTIGVISVMAYSWSAADASPRILTSSGDEGDIDLNDPEIDAFAVRQVTSALMGNYVVKQVNYGGRAFLGDYEPRNPLVYAPVAKLTEKLPNDENVDAYVVFYPIAAQIRVLLRGFGFLRDFPYFMTQTSVYGVYHMAVIDARTHKEIARTDGYVNEVVDNSAWPIQFMPTEDQKALFKRTVQANLEKQIEPALKRVKLLP